MKPKMSNETVTEMAVETVIMDAIQKGHTNKNELVEYMKTDVFEKSVSLAKKWVRKLERKIDLAVVVVKNKN